jgi:hypothetical protein
VGNANLVCRAISGVSARSQGATVPKVETSSGKEEHMAYMQQLAAPYGGLSIFANVHLTVGPPDFGCTNRGDDVMAVQYLLRVVYPRLEVNGYFNEETGFHIFHTQASLKRNGHPGLIVDGVLSPARGSAYGPGSVWTIVLFNVMANQVSPAQYATVVDLVASKPAGR